jgi:hypothetical protein
MFSTGLRGRTRRQQDQSDISWDLELVSRVPPDGVEDEVGMGSPGDLAAELLKMGLYGVCVGSGTARPAPTPGAGQIALNR